MKIIISSALIVVSSIFYLHYGKSLEEKKLMALDPNPMSLYGSPYGRTLGAAVQGPIDLFWHQGRPHDHEEEEGHVCHSEECDHDHHGHDHHGHDHHVEKKKEPWTFKGYLKAMGAAKNHRTNPYSNQESHVAYLRAQVETRLKTAWKLDPTNFANYSCYHLFLTELEVAKSKRDYFAAIQMAKETISFCDRYPEDPRAMLTAAAAAQGMIDVLVNFDRTVGKAFYPERVNAAAKEYLDKFYKLLADKNEQIQYPHKQIAIMSQRARGMMSVQDSNDFMLKKIAAN